MKLTNLIIVAALVVLCVLGWVTLASSSASEGTKYETLIEQAENCMERGLYQRAVENYLAALDGKADEGIYLNIAYAYSLRYAEAPEDTFDEYMQFVKKALASFPGNQTLVDHMVSLCINEERNEADYKTLYPYLKNAINNGCDNESMLALYARARYDYSLRSNTFYAIIDSGTENYAVLTDRGWNMYNTSKGYQLTYNWDYVGPSSSSGITVITGEDSRIFNASTSTVLGIFESPVTASGVFAEDLIPVQADGKYAYYNDYADYKFGSYDYAGTFQNGLAAVAANGEWMLVDTEGETDRNGFEQIVTDLSGCYLVNGTILVKEAGTYVAYDSKWKRQAGLDCDEVDILSKDGIIAFREGNKWGFADLAGNIVIEPEYTNARSFSNGLAAVQNSNGLWGFIDRSGRLVIDYTFADTGYMNSSGICPVRVDNRLSDSAYGPESGGGLIVWEEWAFLSLTNGITKD